MVQKYAIKGSARSCTKWSELRKLITDASSRKLISVRSSYKLYVDLQFADRDDTKEFEVIRGKFIDALNGKAISGRKKDV